MKLALLLALALPALAMADEPAPREERAGALDPAFASSLVGPPRGEKLSGAALDLRTNEVGALVRCPVCQGSTVADSPSDSARNMKREIRDLLAQGYDQEQILKYFEASYGEFIRLEPRRSGIGWLVWLIPALALLGGAFAIRSSLRRVPAAPAPENEAPARDELPDDPELAAAVREVRELAYGWPGGEPPREA